MKEILTRSLSGLLYVSLLIASLYWQHALIGLFFVFGLISMAEFKKLINLKSFFPYIVFVVLYLGFAYWKTLSNTAEGHGEASQILLVITVFVLLILIKDLFSEKTIPLFESKRFIITTFYLTSSFVFLISIANFEQKFSPHILLGSFILVWVNDTFAFLVGKKFGKQKLFPSVSPKKTVEGFLGGLFFSCIASYFIAEYLSEIIVSHFMAEYTETLSFTIWLILAIIISVFGTIGDLIESKFKRQADVKDSGAIMPGHGGLLDRLDSIIFAAPFILLFLRLVSYVS